MNESKQAEALFFACLRHEIFGAPLPTLPDDPSLLSDTLTLAKEQDLSHLVADALLKAGVTDESGALSGEQFNAVMRTARLDYECNRICACLDTAGIDHIPLKGAVIRALYPEAWMRTSCDIDVLVRRDDLDRAVEAIVSSLAYRAEGEADYHDISLYSKSGIHLELHHNIREDMPDADPLLDRVWDHTVAGDRPHTLRMSDGYLLFHVTAHAAYHFTNGGCGVRPLIDLALLAKNEAAVREAEKLCGEANLLPFFRSMCRLSRVWLYEESGDASTERLTDFILRAGLYGTVENTAAVKATKGGRFSAFLDTVFLPYEKIKVIYPILERHPILTPVMEVRRWIVKLHTGHGKSAVAKLKAGVGQQKTEVDSVREMLRELGL